MRTTRPAAVAALGLALALVASACGQDEAPPAGGQDEAPPAGEQEGGTVQIAGQDANDHGTEDVVGMSELELELDDFYFEPTILQGEAGQTVTFSLFNEGDAPHTFTIEDQDIDEVLDPGQEDVTVEVTFPDSGEVLFICRFHEAQGMVGGLTVG